MVAARTLRVQTVSFNVKFSLLIYVKNYTYGRAITFTALYLPLIYSVLGLCMLEGVSD
jgi:hypothetical protein